MSVIILSVWLVGPVCLEERHQISEVWNLSAVAGDFPLVTAGDRLVVLSVSGRVLYGSNLVVWSGPEQPAKGPDSLSDSLVRSGQLLRETIAADRWNHF